MKKTVLLPIVLGLSVLFTFQESAICASQQRFAIAQPATSVNGIPKNGNPLVNEFKFSISGTPYVIKNEKLYIGKSNKGISLTKEGNIEKLYYFLFKGDLVLVTGLSSGGEGWGEITKVDIPQGKIEWKTNIPAFNVGKPLQEKEVAYISGVGFVGKLNLQTGKFIWKQEFYEKYKIDAFGLPVIQGNQVVFKESSEINPKPRTVVVNKTNGNIIKVLKP